MLSVAVSHPPRNSLSTTLRKSAVLLPSVPMLLPSVLPVADPIHHI